MDNFAPKPKDVLAPLESIDARAAIGQKGYMNMTALDEEIEIKRRAYEEIRALMREMEIELRALESAANLLRHGKKISLSPGLLNEHRTSVRKGRQPGAISQSWRKILERIAIQYPKGASEKEIVLLGPGAGLVNLRPRDVRERGEKYIEYGYFQHIEGRYKVTDAARERFGIRSGHVSETETPGEDQSPGAPKSNGALPLNF